MKYKIAAVIYVIIAISTFGLVASNHEECIARAYDASLCSAKTGAMAAVFWPFYYSWVAHDIIR